MFRNRNLILCCLVLLCAGANALPTDQTQKMQITADETLLNYKNGIHHYRGNIHIDQGSTHLTADTLTTQNNKNHKMELAIAYGNPTTPAHYWTSPKAGDELFHAYADVIHFYPQKSLVELTGHVIVSQGKNSFHGNKLIYNIKEQTVLAPINTQGQSTIIIDPRASS